MSLCACPITELAAIGNQECSVDGSQIVAIAIQKLGKTFTDITDQTEWTTNLTAPVDPDDQIYLTPRFYNPLMSGSEPNVIGSTGSNDTPDGALVYNGDGSVEFTGDFGNLAPDLAKQLRAYNCIAGFAGVYILTQSGIWATDASSAIEVESFYTGSRAFTGLNDVDRNAFRISLSGDWQDTADFYPVTWKTGSLKNA